MYNYLPQGKKCYKCLPIRVFNLPNIFPQETYDLFQVFEFIRAYIDDLLILKGGDWTGHVQKVELTINKQKGSGLKYNIEKYFFRKTKMEYFGLWVTHDGVKLTEKNTSNEK